MSFKSLNHILVGLVDQTAFAGLQQFQCLCACWEEVVGAEVSSHTQPISISRGVLWVATSSSAWAQTLWFGRQKILKQLNARLPTPVDEVRFSTAQWQALKSHSKAEEDRVWQEHPSHIAEATVPAEVGKLKDPHAAFQRWAEGIRERSQNLPLCSECQCSTPSGELQRWGVCALCATKQFQCEHK